MSSPTSEKATASPVEGLRIVMLCDDTQIDRRIIHEAESLIHHGADVTVVGRKVEDFAYYETDGGVKIERVDHYDPSKARSIHESVPLEVAAYAAWVRSESFERAANQMQKQYAAFYVAPYWGPPWLEQGLLRCSWWFRNLVRMILWPPMRLVAIRRFFPRMPKLLQYAIYLPTLMLTPWPVAIRWHWVRLKARSRQVMPAKLRTRFEAADAKNKAMILAAKEQEISQFGDLNIWELALYYKACMLRPDVIHVHDLPQLRPAYHVGQTLGIPVIYDAHEMYPCIKTLTEEQQERLRVIENYYIRRVQKAITVNPLIAKRQARDYHVPVPEVILNAIDLPPEFVRGERRTHLRDALKLGPNDKIVLFQGWVSFDRSIDKLIVGMASLPANIHLAILGYGEDIEALKKLAVTYGLSARVHFLKTVPQRDILWWVTSADAGIIPYQAVDENHLLCSPNKLFEFIAAVTPIIAGDLPYLRQVVDVNRFGVVRKLEQPEDYALAIRDMFLAKEGDEHRFRQNMLTKAEPYLWPAQEKTLLRLYADVLSSYQKPKAPVDVVVTGEAYAANPLFSAPLRVFHGPNNTAGIPSIMARAEREMGLDSKAVCYPSGAFGFKPDIELKHVSSPAEVLARFRKYADAFDVFVFHFGASLANDALTDVPLLKRLGKKVIFYFHGCDIRDRKAVIANYEFSACKACFPPRCNPNRELAIDMAKTYADAIWVSTPDLLEFIPGSELFLQPIDLESFPYVERSEGLSERKRRPQLLHAPSDRQLKGTIYIEDALKEINKDQLLVDLTLLQGLSHKQVKERLARADFAVDQLLIGSYGKFAVELMAAGVPTLCYLRPDLLDKYPEVPPMINTTPLTIGETIVEVMRDPSRLRDVARRSRAYVERHHSAESAARHALSVYKRLSRDRVGMAA